MSSTQEEEETKQIESAITPEQQTLEGKEEEGENYSSIEEYFVDCCRYK